MPAALFLSGQRFARLLVESKNGVNRHGQSMWNYKVVPTPDGELPIAEASRRFGLHRDTIDYRLRAGWPQDQVYAPRGVRGHWSA